MKLDAAQLLLTAQLAADRAAAFLAEQEGRLRPESWSAKGRADFVTEVDRESERLIGEVLREAAGGTVIGEELSPGPLPGGLVWIVDPLDGTTNFLHRYPAYAVSIAAAFDGELLAGLVHQVPSGERRTATLGGGAWRGEERLAVSAITDPGHALIGTGFPFRDMDQLPRYSRQFAAVTSATAGLRRAGSAALDLADVASGRFEGFWELRLAPWDVAAGILLIREAGGVVSDLAGGTAGLLGHSSIVAGNPVIHSWLLATLGGA